MKLSSLTMPDKTSDWALWLQSQFVKDNLIDFVRELQVIVGEQPASQLNIQKLLGDNLKRVNKYGLSELTESQIFVLFQQPQLLLELQEQVLLNGGDWVETQLAAVDEISFDERWMQITNRLKQQHPKSTFEALVPTVTAKPIHHTKNSKSSLMKVVATLTLVLLVGLTFWLNQPAPAPGWGFNQSGLLSANVSAPEYLESLSQASQAWFKKRPTNSQELETRLKQFRNGCTVLLSAQHAQLSETDRAWLLGKCQAWINKIDGHLTDLPNQEFQKVQAEADATIQSLSDALHQRSLEAVG